MFRTLYGKYIARSYKSCFKVPRFQRGILGDDQMVL